MSRSLILATLCALALVGCDTTDAPTISQATEAPYASRPIEHGQRFVPAGQVLWSGPADGSAYDSTAETLVDVGALWVDTISHRDQIPVFMLAQEANERSKAAGFDTVYQWERVVEAGEFDSLVGLQARNANGFRIPTPQEAKYLMWGGRTSRPASFSEITLWADPDSTALRNELGIPVAGGDGFNTHLLAYHSGRVCVLGTGGAAPLGCFPLQRVTISVNLLVRSAD